MVRKAMSAMASPRLLVVDDDRLVLAVLVDGLREAGFTVIEVDNGDDAILLAQEHTPDLALLDMRMEGTSGMDVARYLRANTEVPFMFLSAFGDPDIVLEATALGALGYLVKPLELRQIVPAIRAAVARAREIRGLRRDAIGNGAGEHDIGVIDRAVAVLSALLAVSPDEARTRLEQQAQQAGKSAMDVAADIVRAQQTLAIYTTDTSAR